MRKKRFKWLKTAKQKFDIRRNSLTQDDEKPRLPMSWPVNSEAMVTAMTAMTAMTNASEDFMRLVVQWSGGDCDAIDTPIPLI
jgi:hypothetical protein